MTDEVTTALDLIDRGLQSVNGTRDVHVQLQNAVQTVRMELLKQDHVSQPPIKLEAEDGDSLPQAEIVE